MRSKFSVLERRTMPCTSYPFPKRNSARQAPSCPVMPVINALQVIEFLLSQPPASGSTGGVRGQGTGIGDIRFEISDKGRRPCRRGVFKF